MAVLTDKQFMYAGAAAVVGVLLLYAAGRKAVQAAVDTGKGIVTGDNAITKGTQYEGAGILGTLGATANELSGGTLEKLGGSLGTKVYDWLHPDEVTKNQLQSKGIGE